MLRFVNKSVCACAHACYIIGHAIKSRKKRFSDRVLEGDNLDPMDFFKVFVFLV